MAYLQDKFFAWPYLVLCTTLYSAHLHLMLVDESAHGKSWVRPEEAWM